MSDSRREDESEGQKLAPIFGVLNLKTPDGILTGVEIKMSPLDINQTDKGTTERIAIKAFETPGNRFAGGQMDYLTTKQMVYDEWEMISFYFPVDSCIWDVGCTWSHQVTRNNDHSDIQLVLDSRTQQPTNAEAVHQIGISMFSNRDKPWDGSNGCTPMTPKGKMSRQPDGSDMEWTADVIVGLGTEEIALRNRGYYNKAARQILYFNQVSTGTNVSKTIDFSKKTGKGRRSKKKAFDVDAGTKLLFWTRNTAGSNDSNFVIETAAQITPRIRWFPKKNVIQNFKYQDQSEQRWGAAMVKNLRSDDGDGCNELFTHHNSFGARN